MRKPVATLLLLVLVSLLLGATHSALDNRRIEQEKRDSLSATETIISTEIGSAEKPQEPPELRYLKQLLSKKVATLSDASQALSILLKQQERFPDFPRQFSYFQEHQLLPAGVSLQDADKPLRKGIVAYLFCRGLGIRGGVWLRVFGMSQRYALRELAHEGMISSGSIHEIVSGPELVVLFVSAAEYLVKKGDVR